MLDKCCKSRKYYPFLIIKISIKMFKKSVLRKFCKKMDILVLKMKLCWPKKNVGNIIENCI